MLHDHASTFMYFNNKQFMLCSHSLSRLPWPCTTGISAVASAFVRSSQHRDSVLCSAVVAKQWVLDRFFLLFANISRLHSQIHGSTDYWLKFLVLWLSNDKYYGRICNNIYVFIGTNFCSDDVVIKPGYSLTLPWRSLYQISYVISYLI